MALQRDASLPCEGSRVCSGSLVVEPLRGPDTLETTIEFPTALLCPWLGFEACTGTSHPGRNPDTRGTEPLMWRRNLIFRAKPDFWPLDTLMDIESSQMQRLIIIRDVSKKATCVVVLHCEAARAAKLPNVNTMQK